MCGITGYIDFNNRIENNEIEKMVKTLSHRGPDDYGAENYRCGDVSLGIAQSRLAILDLTDAGHQPMHYKHLSIVFNGEIYNFKEIKSELEALGHNFETNSDTEVILHAFHQWDEDSVHKFIGMFAFLIFDKKHSLCYIFRDRAGVKPLYYYFKDNLFLFGSELKALMACSRFEKEIDDTMMPIFLNYGYIPTPHSIFKNCFKVRPGSILTINLLDKNIESKTYWCVDDYYKLPKIDILYDEAKKVTHDLLVSACQFRMVSDVPVGVFLSGGYDSTLVTALLQKNVDTRLKTFTIGFDEGNNEAPYARKIAEYLGTEHTEYYCDSKDARPIIEELPYYYDEPYADSSAIPTTLVSGLAKKHVGVVLSADGGDEVFCGYSVYFQLDKYFKKLDLIPNDFKDIFKSIGTKIALGVPFLDVQNRHKIHTYFNALNSSSDIQQSVDLYKCMIEKPENYIYKYLKIKNNSVLSLFKIDSSNYQNPIDVIMAIDYKVYLTDDILTKVDRATMSVSLEGREPLIDHRIIEYVAQLPLNFKYNGKTGKVILKDIVHDYIPKQMMDREKAGFSVPINSWLRSDLSYLLDEYMNKESLKWSGLFDEVFILNELEKFKRHNLHYSHLIWYVLMFQMWYKKWML